MVFHLPEYNVRSINNFILDKELELKDETEIGLGITRGNLYLITRKLSIKNDINELNSYIFDNDL